MSTKSISCNGNITSVNTSELIRPARHLAVFARMIPNPLLQECLQRLEVDIDAKDREAVSTYHGYALAAVDIIRYMSEHPEAIEQAGTGAALSPPCEEALVGIRRSLTSLTCS